MSYPHIEHASSTKDLEHNCDKYLELKSRNKGAGVAYAFQCQYCGEFRGQEVSKKKVQNSPPFGDLTLQDTYQKKYSELIHENNINSGVASILEDIKSLDEKILEIGSLIENYCHENNTDPKSLVSTYLMRQRESHITENYNLVWNSEKELCLWFSNIFSKWFDVYNEVTGIGYLNRKKQNLRIDFIIKAKEELISHGFTDKYIGVEVKYLNPHSGNGFHGKSSRGVFQALSYWYSGARWNLLNQGEVELSSVLMFSNLSFYDEASLLFNTMDSHYKKIWHSYLSIANHANVGELLVRVKQNQLISWGMDYSGAKYYSMHVDRGFVKGNPSLINKNRIGSQKLKST